MKNNVSYKLKIYISKSIGIGKSIGNCGIDSIGIGEYPGIGIDIGGNFGIGAALVHTLLSRDTECRVI